MRSQMLESLDRVWGGTRRTLRSLSRQPTLVVVATLTIAVGTAATTAMLSVRSALVGRSLPVADPGTLHLIDEQRGGAVSQMFGVDAMPYARYLSYVESLGDAFAGLAAERYRFPGGFSLTAPEGAVSAHGYLVSGNYFDVLGLRPTIGRFFAADEEPSVVLSHRFWRQRFAGDPGVLNRTVSIDSRSYVVVGVAPDGFEGTTNGVPSDIWIPFERYFERDDTSFDGWVTVFGRLRSGVSPGQARAAVVRAATTIAPLQPQTRVRGADVPPLTGLPPGSEGPVSGFLTLLVGTGVIVLLIAAANVAGMLLARGTARRREVAVRLALGAGRGRIAWQGLSEALLLFAVGGLGGVWLGALATRAIQAVRIPIGFDFSFDLTPDIPVVAVGVLITALVGGTFGLLPSLQSARGNVVAGLKATAEGSGREAWGWRLFVRAQLGLSVLLLVIAGLFVRTLQKASDVDLGFDAEGVVVAQIELDAHGYGTEQASAFFQELVERVRGLPGVTSATLASTVLLGPQYGRSSNDMRPVEGAESVEPVNAGYSIVEPGYFDVLGTPLVMGRDFSSFDRPGAPAAAIVNETLAERLWPGQNPIGRRLRGGGEFEVVGVVRDGKYSFVDEAPSAYLFRAYAQNARSRMTLHVRSSLPAARTIAGVGQIVRELDPNVALQAVQPLASVVGLSLFPQRFAAWLVGIFGLVGLLFAAVGVYGILHFHVTRRTREVGVRVALGADPGRVFREMLGRGARLAAVAAGLGLAAAGLTTRLLSGLMIGITPLDPLTFLAAALLLMLVVTAASAIPARRATRVDPATALRAE